MVMIHENQILMMPRSLSDFSTALKNQQDPEEIVEHGIQKALEKGPIHTKLREQVHVTSNQNSLLLFIIFFFCNTFFIRSLLLKLNSICFIKWKRL
jgi:hypothetical protein